MVQCKSQPFFRFVSIYLVFHVEKNFHYFYHLLFLLIFCSHFPPRRFICYHPLDDSCIFLHGIIGWCSPAVQCLLVYLFMIGARQPKAFMTMVDHEAFHTIPFLIIFGAHVFSALGTLPYCLLPTHRTRLSVSYFLHFFNMRLQVISSVAAPW